MVQLTWMNVKVMIDPSVSDEHAEAALEIVQSALRTGARYAELLLKNETRPDRREIIDRLKGLTFKVE